MGNLFSNLFKKGKQPNESVISFKYLNQIYSYLYYEKPNFNFKIKGFFDKIYVNRFDFPDSFENYKNRSEITSCGLSNEYEVLNLIFSKIDIASLSQDLIDQKYPISYIHIQFYSKIQSPVNKSVNSILQNFIIFFSCDNGSEQTNGFRILYSNSSFIFYARNLLDSKYLENFETNLESEKIAFKDFETVIIGICQYLNIEIPEHISNPNLLSEEATQEHFEELLNLITRNEIDEKINKKQVKKMFTKYKKQSEDYNFFEENYEFLENVNCWHSDWKFDPEDVEYFISEMTQQEFTFEYPDETYSHNLFPYIQKELSKSELELMSFDTQSDSYLFFLANKKEVNRILELAQIIDIKVDRLL